MNPITNIEGFRAYCLGKAGVTEAMPFDDKTLVFKVGNKIFALTGLESETLRVNLKCDPEWAVSLRETYQSITPGYHMNKKHWNTVEMHPSIPRELFRKMIDHSYDLVFASLPVSVKKKIKQGLRM